MRFCMLKRGDRVRLTRRGRDRFPDAPATGVVTTYSRRWPGCVNVRPVGRRRPETWAPWLWQRASDGRVGRAV